MHLVTFFQEQFREYDPSCPVMPVMSAFFIFICSVSWIILPLVNFFNDFLFEVEIGGDGFAFKVGGEHVQ